ncbi:MAG: NTF2-like N-terminal transpeptidase domain-containing protein [Chloroflexota bacterium]|nr:NTF2-like N-terminal transpeptidase domain-containing protein [Chloroflexota bacterium]
MLAKWRRYGGIARAIGILIVVAVVAVVLYQVYDFYSDKVGFTPSKAIETYFQALAAGDYEEVYRLTAKESLTDIYGRDVTRGEFMEQLEGIAGGHSLPLEAIEMEKLFEAQKARYYEVFLTFSVGGTSRQSRLLVEVRREKNSWVVTHPFAIVL